MVENMTEDEVRDKAREILSWDSIGVTAGVGQLTTFNQLGFKGKLDKPDGWYLPSNKADTAIVLETKASKISLGTSQVKELLKNIRIMNAKYEHVVGILYNGNPPGYSKMARNTKEMEAASSIMSLTTQHCSTSTT